MIPSREHALRIFITSSDSCVRALDCAPCGSIIVILVVVPCALLLYGSQSFAAATAEEAAIAAGYDASAFKLKPL